MSLTGFQPAVTQCITLMTWPGVYQQLNAGDIGPRCFHSLPQTARQTYAKRSSCRCKIDVPYLHLPAPYRVRFGSAMAPPVTFDMQRLRQQHDMSDPQSLSKFQCTVYDFVQMARTNIDVSEDHLREFCNLVAHKETWPLAQTMVPEFHSVRKER